MIKDKINSIGIKHRKIAEALQLSPVMFHYYLTRPQDKLPRPIRDKLGGYFREAQGKISDLLNELSSEE